MLGQKALAVVLTALLLTLLAGYVLNVEETDETRTVYDPIADLTPVFASTSDRVMGFESYTGPYTVTAWSPATLIPRSTVSNAYLITPTVEDYDVHPVTWRESDHAMATGEPYGEMWRTTVPGVYLTRNGMTDGSTVYGGAGGTSTVTLWTNVLSYDVLDSEQPSSWATVAVPIMDLVGDIALVDGLRVTIDPSWWTGSGLQDRALYDYIYTTGYTETDRYHRITPTWSGTAHALSSTYTWSEPIQKWVDADGVSSRDVVFFRVDPTGYTARTLSASVDTPMVTEAIYADPTRLLDVTEDTATATWSANLRNPTLVTGRVDMLLMLNWSDDRIVIDAGGTSVTVDYSGTGADARVRMTVGDTEVPLGTLGAYRALILSFNGIDGTLDVFGVLRYENALAYETGPTLASVDYPVGSVTSVSVTADSGGAGVRIVGVWIQTDPSGVLWHDPSVDLTAYLPGDADALRIVMGGWIATGEAVTINGNPYEVTDGKITVVYTEGGKLRTKALALSGLTVDYHNGHVSVSSTGREPIDLGETVDSVITLTGTWYGSITADRIGETTVTGYTHANAWSMTEAQILILFIGISIVGTAICLAVRRDTWGIVDWAVVGVSIIIAFVLL